MDRGSPQSMSLAGVAAPAAASRPASSDHSRTDRRFRTLPRTELAVILCANHLRAGATWAELGGGLPSLPRRRDGQGMSADANKPLSGAAQR
jgi:hypothetical protein